jgi:hypothetical protein
MISSRSDWTLSADSSAALFDSVPPQSLKGLAGPLHRAGHLGAEGVGRRSIAKLLRKEWQHRRDNSGIGSRRRIVVEIDRTHAGAPF